MSITLNQMAPDFNLSDQENKKHQLKDYRGKWLLLYFYPKDNTPGCTTEACTIRDSWSSFAQLNAVVLGVSADSVSSHEKFANKFTLPFPILADENKEVIREYGVLVEKTMFGKKFMGIKRSSFLIDPNGKIAKIYKTVKPAEHAAKVLEDIKNLSK